MRALSLVAGIVVAGASFALLAGDERDRICRPGYSASIRHEDNAEWRALKKDMFTRIAPMVCGMTWGACSPAQFELDHIVPLCLGGPGDKPPNDPSNLQLQPWGEARAKDKLEAQVCHAYCSGKTTMEDARHFFASGDWRSVIRLKELLP